MDLSQGQWPGLPMIAASVNRMAKWSGGKPDQVMRQIFLDTETTSLNAEGGDHIVETVASAEVGRRLASAMYHYYLNPRPRSPALRCTTDEFLADAGAVAADRRRS
ncbi:MAG: hypothetical protein U1E95_07760 [Rubrivivax sp.]